MGITGGAPGGGSPDQSFTIERVRQKLETPFPTANAAVKVLEDLGIMTEMTGHKKNRSDSYQPYIELLSQLLRSEGENTTFTLESCVFRDSIIRSSMWRLPFMPRPPAGQIRGISLNSVWLGQPERGKGNATPP